MPELIRLYEKGDLYEQEKEREPQWYMSSTNIPMLNYNEYYMKKIEWLMYAIAFAAIGAVIGYIFMVESDLIYMENLRVLLI